MFNSLCELKKSCSFLRLFNSAFYLLVNFLAIWNSQLSCVTLASVKFSELKILALYEATDVANIVMSNSDTLKPHSPFALFEFFRLTPSMPLDTQRMLNMLTCDPVKR